MNRTAMGLLLGAALAVGGLAGTAAAQPAQYRPGSILLYPLWIDVPGVGSLISVTNTNSSRRVLPNNYRVGDVTLHYFYVEGLTWRIFDRRERLTPNDILTLNTQGHNPEGGTGFLYVIAEDPETERPIDFDYLIGKETIIDLLGGVGYTAVAYAFEGVRTAGEAAVSGFFFTDADNDGLAEFDGIEYARFPDRLFVDSFFEQVPSGMIDELVLVTTLGQDYRVSLNYLIYNNREDVFSRSFTFTCWTRVSLDRISSVTVFPNLNGPSTAEARTGWARINGDTAVHVYTGQTVPDPPFLGLHVMLINAPPAIVFEGMRLLHQTGEQDGQGVPNR